jgi:hypothetical protein
VGQETLLPRFVSRELFIRVKCAPEPAYLVGRRAGVEPALLSRLLRDRLRPIDEPRVLRLAAEVGLPPERAFGKRPPVGRE